MIDKTNITPGFYWVKKKDDRDYNIIVKIYGEAPFLKITCWDTYNNELAGAPSSIFDILDEEIIPIIQPKKEI